MPNYDFVCPGCKYAFERVVPSSETTTICPACGIRADRQVSAPLFSVQGGTPKFHTR